MTQPQDPASSPPQDKSTGAHDPDWVKDVVAKALLHASTSETPIEPTPAGRAPSNWPTMSAIDTASTAGASVASLDLPLPPSSDVPDARAEAVGDQREVQRDAVDIGSVPAFAAPAPDALPAVVPEAMLEAIPATTLVTQRNSTLDPAQEIELETPDTDNVMIETDANTDGYRSSDLRTILEWIAVIIAALVVALLIKGFVLQAFWIPSESMETTVNKGDRILVNKVSYDLHDVRRGDLVVFEKLEGTPGNTKDLIKRAIALPGETIEVRDDGRIWIWGAGETPEDAKLLEEPYLDAQNTILSAPTSSDPIAMDVWHGNCVNQPRTPGRCTLDENSYFMMGDNRFRSSDSRSFGPIPEENIVGRAFLRIWPLGDISTL